MWFINRTGQSEGPFPEQQIIQMIQAGQLTAAHVCPQGGNQWVALQQHPAFAAALQGGAGQPGQPGQGQPGQGGPMHGSPAQATPGGAMAAAAGGAGAKKKGPPMGLIIGGAVAAVVAIGVVLFFVFSGGGSALSEKVPADTQIFFEVADVPGALADAVGMEAIETKELNAKQKIGEIADGLKDAFDIKKSDAEAVLEGIESVGFAARNIKKDDKVAAVMAFNDADGVDALLKADRFEKDGEISGGTRYLLKRVKEEDYEVIKGWSPARKAFAMMSFDEESKDMFVWFADAKVLVMGHKTMVEDIGGVLSGDDKSLADSDKWGKAQIEKGAAIIFVDSALIEKNDDDDFEDFARGYFRDVAPLVGTINFVDAGLSFNAHGELKGNKISEDDAVPAAVSLDIYEKLPKETVAYWAFSMERSEDGKAVKKRMLKRVKSVDEKQAERFEEVLDTLKDKVGVDLETILDSVGDQFVVAVLADKSFAFDPEADIKDNLDKFALVLMYEVGDEEKAKKVVDKLRKVPFDEEPLSVLYEVEKKDDGFNAVPNEEAAKKHIPPIKVRLANDHIMLAVGSAEMITEAAKALKDGDNSLGDDGGHKAAIDVVGNEAHVLTWLDVGRFGEVGLKYIESNDDIKEKIEAAEKEFGFSHKAVRMRGDKRVTAAAALQLETKGETMHWRLRTLNMPAYGVLGVVKFVQDAAEEKRRREERARAFSVDTGHADCDRFIRRLQECSREPGKAILMSVAELVHADYKKNLDKAKGKGAVTRAIGSICRKKMNSPDVCKVGK